MILIFLATFVRVFLLALQNQNVIGGHYGLAVLTSFFLGITDVAVVLLVGEGGWESIFYVCTGGAAGVTSAMFIHRRFIQ